MEDEHGNPISKDFDRNAIEKIYKIVPKPRKQQIQNTLFQIDQF